MLFIIVQCFLKNVFLKKTVQKFIKKTKYCLYIIKYIGLCRFLPSDFQVKGDIFNGYNLKTFVINTIQSQGIIILSNFFTFNYVLANTI